MPIWDNISGVYHKTKPYSNINGVWVPDKKTYDNIAGVWRQGYSSEIKWTYVATKSVNPGYIYTCTPEATNAFHFEVRSNSSGKDVQGYVDYTFSTPVNLPAVGAITANGTGGTGSTMAYIDLWISINGGPTVLSHHPDSLDHVLNLAAATAVSTLQIMAHTVNTSGDYIEHLILHPVDHDAFALNNTGISS